MRTKPELTQAARPAAYEVDAVNEKGERVPTPVAGEHPLTLYLDKREVVTLILQKINCMFSAPLGKCCRPPWPARRQVKEVQS